MTKECALIDGIIYCQCGDQSSHYGTMGKRGAREVRCEAPPQRSSNQCDVSASEPTSYVVEGNTYRELIAERDRLRVHLRQKSEQITRLQDGIEKMQQGSAERSAPEPPADDVEVNRCLYVAGLQQDDASHAAHVTACKVLAAEVRRLRSALPPAAELPPKLDATMPTVWHYLLVAAHEVVEAVDFNHDNKAEPLKWTVPWAKVTALRDAALKAKMLNGAPGPTPPPATAPIERYEAGLAILYGVNYQAVARVCDEVIDKSGALLGRVRALARSAPTKPCDCGAVVNGVAVSAPPPVPEQCFYCKSAIGPDQCDRPSECPFGLSLTKGEAP